jgi:hypothetical protein
LRVNPKGETLLQTFRDGHSAQAFGGLRLAHLGGVLFLMLLLMVNKGRAVNGYRDGPFTTEKPVP